MEAQPLVLCDTNILIEFYKAKAEILSPLQQIGQSRIAVSVVTAGELIYGAFNRHELNQIKKDMKHLKLLHINKETGEIFLEIIAKYSLSHNLTVPDAFIAATAMHYDVELYTLNKKDFRYIKGLKLFKER
jgi:tRNA(fMet)-specific endonuclease VapC